MNLTLEQFTPLIGKQFTVQTQIGTISLTLAEAEERPRRNLPEAFRTPLSLIFDGPDNLRLEQDNYVIEHPDLGQYVWALTPVQSYAPGRSPDIPQYQVLFA